jgi:hypothetical protein
LSNGGSLSIQNEASVAQPSSIQPATVSVAAGQVHLTGAQISAASKGNVAASNVFIDAADQIVLRDAAIVTTAKDGNGGGIRLDGGRAVLLSHSEVSTSVLGLDNGNGGDISVATPVLVLETGFIQANTAATRATGGNVLINVEAFVTSGQLLVNIGSPVKFSSSLSGINVIQAVAPEGVSGDVRIAKPALDIAGDIRRVPSEVIDFGALGKDWCRVGAGSSFTPMGRGGLRPASSELIRPEAPIDGLQISGQFRSRAQMESSVAKNSGAENRYRCEY